MYDTLKTIKITTEFPTSSYDSPEKYSYTQPNQSTYQDIIDNKVKERSMHAQSLQKLGDVEGAKREYRKLIFLSPKAADFHKGYAEALAQTDEIQEALVHYKRAQSIAYDPDVHEKIYELMLKKGYNMLGNTQYDAYLESLEGKTVKLEATEVDLTKTLNPGNPEGGDKVQGFFVRALAYLSENRKGKAIQELDKCTELDGKNIYAYILKAKIYWNLNQVKKGYEEFWKAFEINPDHAEVKEFLKMVKEKIKKLYDQAIKYFWQNDYEKTIYFVNKGMEIEPKSVRLLLLRSLIYRKNKKFDQALKDIETASLSLKEFPDLEDEIKRNLAVTYNEMGIQMMSKEDYKNALSLFDEALKFKANDWGIIANKGDCYFKMKKYDMAKDQYNVAYNHNPKGPTLGSRLGLCCFYSSLEKYNAKDLYRALQLMEEALTWDPKNVDFLCWKGKVCLLLNDPKKAFQSYKAANDINPKHKEALAYLAQFPSEVKIEKDTFKRTTTVKQRG